MMTNIRDNKVVEELQRKIDFVIHMVSNGTQESYFDELYQKYAKSSGLPNFNVYNYKRFLMDLKIEL